MFALAFKTKKCLANVLGKSVVVPYILRLEICKNSVSYLSTGKFKELRFPFRYCKYNPGKFISFVYGLISSYKISKFLKVNFKRFKIKIFLFLGLCGREPQPETRRRKRDISSLDDTLDDQDDISLFNPPNISITPATWPTPKGLNKAEVTDICNQKIRKSKGGQICGTVAGVNIDNLVQGCISDIQVG